MNLLRFNVNPLRLNRRTLLRGAGVAVALPTLDAMLSDRGLLHGVAHAQERAAPKRMVIFFMPNGLACPSESNFENPILDDWVPGTTGGGYELRPALEPLAPFREHFNVLSGLDLGVAGVGGGHERGTCGFATCVGNSGSGAGGPSVEQFAAQKLGDATKFRSLVTANQSVPDNYDPPLKSISFSGPGAPVPQIRRPQELFDKLFEGSMPAGQAAGPSDLVLRRRSVLDFVKGDLTRLNGVLGSSDRQRLEAHLTAVRELERQLDLESSGAGSVSCQAPAAPTVDSSKYSDEGQRVMIDMVALALKCDLTRYASVMLSIGGSSEGPCPSQHALTHARDRAQCLPMTQLHVGFFAQLLGRLSDATAAEGAGTVLDNSILYLGCEMSDGSAHSNNYMPVVLAGKAGGHRTGRHIAYPRGTLMSKMMLSMLQLGGVPTDEFANTREPLDQLTT